MRFDGAGFVPALFLYTLATIIGLLGVRAKATTFKGGSMKQYTVAILGATGAVGTQMLECLNEQEFPVGKLKLLASARSAGKTVEFRGEQIVIEEACPEAFEGCDIVLGAAGDDIAKELLPEAVKRGASWSTTAMPSAWIPRCRWSCPRSMPTISSGITA